MSENVETRVTKLEHEVYGNGDVGMAERLRHVEDRQRRYEDARQTDRRANEDSISTIHGTLDVIKTHLDESAGGWRVARILAGFGIPLVLGLLSFIAYRLSVVTQ